ncbi:putative galacturonosyltransferase 7 isoform X1 [Canna indica]|uniref:Hexosyltransferase n=1 Tax=Canna indica TaxID=4628 RepID=A0AAQ3QCY7_9LILI|nr:putative galacturonosyltransferase 7 isoform X1 [Canna indica]
MKVFVTISTPTLAKRRWRAPAAAVLVLVLFSLLAPLAFLLGLHNRFPSGYVADNHLHSETSFLKFGQLDGVDSSLVGDGSRVEDLVKKFGPMFSKDVAGNHTPRTGELLNRKLVINSTAQLIEAGKDISSNSLVVNMTSHSELQNSSSFYKPDAIIYHSKVDPVSQVVPSNLLPGLSTKQGRSDSKNINFGGIKNDGIKDCQLEFGSYCLWSVEHKEIMKDSTVKKLKDQLFVARAYYPSIAKLNGQQKLSRDLKQNIQEHERMLGEAIVDTDLPKFVDNKIQKMEQTISRAKFCTVECNNVQKKLRQILDLTEDESNFHMKQSAFLYHLAVQTMPKSIHCLSMRLTVEFFKSLPTSPENPYPKILDRPNLMHYVIFSKNVLAAAVTINSTIMSSEVNRNMFFHVVTDAQNYYAMKLWFARNLFEEATIFVINFEELSLKHHYTASFAKLSLSEEYRVSIHKLDQPATQISTEYIALFGHSHFFLPDIFSNLKKVVVLDDDVVVQRDLSPLWNLNLNGKVNGAVEFCGLRLGQLKNILGKNSYDADSCAWMSGLNIIDLEKWREHNVTETYLQLLDSFQTKNEASPSFPASLITFSNLIYPLNEKWSLPGLGHSYDINADAISSAASLHYNGNMKPWLDLGIPMYKKHWKKFLAHNEVFMDECMVNP